ncbi:hypothetical protein ANN_26023 [Periplaneta americana]|uniref:Reverse transcriptase domain-containing protein n=1 Tax=Periplaneta americana TaxID=6978 RepID=A0ABQ8S4R8_PERAM|nr:hypothetical protein ANN_26023 [Periplaneta americana]
MTFKILSLKGGYKKTSSHKTVLNVVAKKIRRFKAFDKVWHEGLLYKLKPIISDTLFTILQSYLCNRTFSVKYENVVSQVRSIQAGVPQGSILGPYLYLIYVSNFPRDANLTVAQIADDVAVLCKDSCETAANKLQQFLHLVYVRCNKWKVKMNPSKSSVIQFTYKRKTENQSITLQGEEVSHAESVRYLGLHLDRKLTWNTHISNLVNRRRHKLYQVKHLLKGSSPLPLHLKRLMYFSLIRPIWTYMWYMGICIQFPNQTNSDNTELGSSSNRGWTQVHPQ